MSINVAETFKFLTEDGLIVLVFSRNAGEVNCLPVHNRNDVETDVKLIEMCT